MIEILFGGAVASLLVFLATWVLAARPGDRLNRALCAYFTLTAGVMLALAAGRTAKGDQPDFYSHLILWFDLPQFFLVPFVLDEVLFPKPRTRSRRVVLVAAALAVAGLLFALARWPELYWYYATAAPPDTQQYPSPGILQHVYAFGNDALHALAALVAAYVARRPDLTLLQRRQAALVSAGFGCLALHAAAASVGTMPLWKAGSLAGPAYVVGPDLGYLVGGLTGLLMVPALGWIVGPFTGRARAAVVTALSAAAFIGALQGPVIWLAQQPSYQLLGPLAIGLRPIVLAEFAVFLAVAVFRFGMAGVILDARARLTTATGVVLVVSLWAGVFVAALAWIGVTPLGAGAGFVAGAAALALPLTPLRGLPARITDRILIASDDPRVTRERARIYAAALRGSMSEPGRAGVSDTALRALRAQLGLSERDHEILLSAVDDEPETMEPGALLVSRYRITCELGRGGFGEAFLARDERESRDVVLKRLVGEHRRDAVALRRFEEETRLAGALTHPNIVRVEGVENVGHETYLVMEYMRGGSVTDRLRSQGPFSEAEATRLAQDVLAALGALHARGIIHRDVKPSNILLDATGTAKLGDFTVAKEVVSGETAGGAPRFVGTVAYMSPEQARGLPATPRSDLYSLGATLYEALTGEAPIAVDGMGEFEACLKIVQQEPELPIEGVSSLVNDVLLRALAKDPALRFASAQEMSDALDATR